MGVNLGELVAAESIEMDHLQDRTLAVDALNTIYQFLSVIRQPDGTPLQDADGNVTSHLSGLLHRTTHWLEHGIWPVFVFDGPAPDLKQKENLERRERREAAYQEYRRLKEEGRVQEALAKATQSTKVTDAMISSAQALLDAMGIPYVEAPSEGEAQAAYMSQHGHVDGVVSQDYDTLVFGASQLIKNLSIVGKRKLPGKAAYTTITPERISLTEVLHTLDITHEQLQWLAVLVGTDFNGGVSGIGPKTALRLVKEHDSFEALLEQVAWEEAADPSAVLAFLQDPPVKDMSFTFGQPDTAQIHELLVEQHAFSAHRVEKTVQRLRRARQHRQTGLGAFT